MSHTHLLWKRRAAGALGATATLALTVALTGCGGSKTNPNMLGAAPNLTPAVYGLDPVYYNQSTFGMDSSLETPDGKTAYATGASASTANVASGIAQTPFGGGTPTIPLGFAPGAATITGNAFGKAVAPGASVIFRAAIANGNFNGQVSNIVPGSVVLTSPESGLSGFSQQLTFNNPNGGITPAATYTTGTFTLPFTTTGVHTLRVSVSDVNGQSSTTDFGVIVLAGSDSAMLAQVTDAKGNPLVGATVSLGGTAISGTSDNSGTVLLFAPAGTYTVNVKSSDGATTYSASETLTAGTLLDTMVTGTGSSATTGPLVLAPGS